MVHWKVVLVMMFLGKWLILLKLKFLDFVITWCCWFVKLGDKFFNEGRHDIECALCVTKDSKIFFVVLVCIRAHIRPEFSVFNNEIQTSSLLKKLSLSLFIYLLFYNKILYSSYLVLCWRQIYFGSTNRLEAKLSFFIPYHWTTNSSKMIYLVIRNNEWS